MLIDWLPGAALALDPLTILLLALAFDAALGDPRWLYRALPHPIALLGRAIEAGERALNHPDLAGRSRFWRGFGLTLALVFLAAGFGRLIESLLATFSGGWIIEALLASSLIAFRSLHDHVRAVANGLERSLEDGRMAVSHIVGRDPQSLDQAGIARAAAESTAENFSDGLVAPVFWFAAFGLAGLCAYKTVNTLDSMIGYRSERHEAFGKAAARLDDALNWVPARLAGLLFVAAAALLPGAQMARAWSTMRRDASKHRSPNAGWQEAAMAGALDFRLAGPRHYAHGAVDDHWMGNGRADLGPEDLRAALRLYSTASGLLAALVGAALLL